MSQTGEEILAKILSYLLWIHHPDRNAVWVFLWGYEVRKLLRGLRSWRHLCESIRPRALMKGYFE